MANYRKVKKLSRKESAYIAGIIDGEGTISLTRKHRGEHRQLMVNISSAEQPLLKYVLKVIGAGRITNKCTYRDNHTPSVTYAISNRQALAVLEQVRPHLKTYKAKRAQLIMRSYIRLTPRNGKYTQAQLKERDIFIEKFLRLNPRRKTLTRLAPTFSRGRAGVRAEQPSEARPGPGPHRTATDVQEGAGF